MCFDDCLSFCSAMEERVFLSAEGVSCVANTNAGGAALVFLSDLLNYL
jgi:hypothetical protein